MLSFWNLKKELKSYENFEFFFLFFEHFEILNFCLMHILLSNAYIDSVQHVIERKNEYITCRINWIRSREQINATMHMARVHWGEFAMKIVYNGGGKKCTMWWMIFLLTFISSPGPNVHGN